MDRIDKRLEPYFIIALNEADKSPCVRRKYAAMIVYDWYGDMGDVDIEWNPWHINANERVTKQCDMFCIRDRSEIRHGQSVEIGAEIHAEQAVLIKAGIFRLHSYFILAGKNGKTGEELLGKECLPCHTCCVMLKWAGYKNVYHKDSNGNISADSIEDIIAFHEGNTEAGISYD